MSQTPAPVRIEMMIGSYVFSQLLYVTASLKLADLTWQTPRSVEDLARATATDARALHRVMISLALLGVFERVDQQGYRLAPGNERLLSAHPRSLVPYILVSGDVYYKAFAELLSCLRTGGNGCATAFGQTFFELLQSREDLSGHFQASLGQDLVAALDAYDFRASRQLVDVGAGTGTIAAALLQRYPHLQTTLFDLPLALASARASLQQYSDRCRFCAGDFFCDALPAGADTYLLARIIHDWDDAQALQILKACRQAMGRTSTLLLVEFVLDGPISARQALEDLYMLVVTGGQERTLAEFRTLLRQADLQLVRVLTTRNQRCIIEAVPATDPAG